MARQPIRMLATGAAYVLAYVCLTLYGPSLSRSNVDRGATTSIS